MEIEKIALFKSIDRISRLVLIIGIKITGRPRHINNFHPGQNADSFNQVNG